MGFFDKLKAGLKKTKDALLKPVNDLFSSYDKVDEDFYDELCDLLANWERILSVRISGKETSGENTDEERELLRQIAEIKNKEKTNDCK